MHPYIIIQRDAIISKLAKFNICCNFDKFFINIEGQTKSKEIIKGKTLFLHTSSSALRKQILY